jgi:hypothetical protein
MNHVLAARETVNRAHYDRKKLPEARAFEDLSLETRQAPFEEFLARCRKAGLLKVGR